VSRPTPTAEAQLEFLGRIERILAEGKFTTTYKFALLIAITNIAVEKGNDTGDELKIDLDEIARQFLSLYWSMARLYPGIGEVLQQSTNSKKPATMLSALNVVCTQAAVSYARRRVYHHSQRKLVSNAMATIKKDVLYRLQSLGPGATARGDAFLYESPLCSADCRGLRSITLVAGASACLRRLRGVIIAMVEARWALWVRNTNTSLGADRTLEAFMFGAERANVGRYAEPLFLLQSGTCFYTGEKLSSPAAGEVDHFIPWSRYPFDSPFNLVLASTKVNRAKTDLLAPPNYCDAWLHRNEVNFSALVDDPFNAMQEDRKTARAIAAWMYSTRTCGNTLPTYAKI